MATIILNGVENNTNPLAGSTDLNDKLTVSGGSANYEADMQGGSDHVEIDQAGEDVTEAKIAGGDGDDLIEVDNSAFEAKSFSGTLSGGLGDDTIGVGVGDVKDTTIGMVTLTGRAAGNAGDDYIKIIRAEGATVQAGADDDYVEIGDFSPADGPGSRGDTTIVDTSVNGGSGDDDITVLYAAKLTDTTINGGQGIDSLYIDGDLASETAVVVTNNTDGSTTISADSVVKAGGDKDKIYLEGALDNTFINGNSGPDWIKAYGELDSTDGSLISGAKGHDTISVADAGALTVLGGAGKDMLRVGSGQTVIGGANADTFSIEAAGGVTIEDFDALNTVNGENRTDCFCSDVIQVDGNKITYSTYNYKVSKQKYTSASSYFGNIKVKAFQEDIYCTTYATGEGGAQKSAIIEATAYVKYKATEFKADAKYSTLAGVATGYGDFNPVSFPATFKGGAMTKAVTNGNAPRPTNDPSQIGFGAAIVTGYVTARGITDAGINNFRSVVFPNATAYTTTQFEKGDFSFLNEPFSGSNTCVVTQKLVFDDVTRGTITNHWVDFGVAKTTTKYVSLYDMKLGTANFEKVTTGKANLVITKGLVDNTYYPTPDQITNNALLANGIVANVNQTAGGKYEFTRTDNAAASANGELNLSSASDFTLWTKRNDGIGVVPGKLVNGTMAGVADASGWVKYAPASNGGGFSWTQAVNNGLLSLTVATQVTGNVQPFFFSKGMNHTQRVLNNFTTTVDGAVLDPFRTVTKTTKFNGASGGVNDTRTATGNLVAKIKINGTDDATDTAYLPSWLGRAVVKGVEFTPETCYYPSSLYYNKVSDATPEQGIHNRYTPASVAPSQKGEWGTKYMWTNYSAVDLNGSNDIADLPFSNGCPTSSGKKTEFSCISYEISDLESTNYVNADRAIFGINGLGDKSGLVARANAVSNNAFFSASQFTPVALAAEGMGDNAATAEGAPFRVLFFDTKGSDNGLYLMAGTANYKKGDVTALNTNPTHSSAIGGKQTIVNVTGGKGFEISLSDINFV